MDFRSHEAEMAALRGESPEPSPLNEEPGSRLAIHVGWSAPWLNDQDLMQKRADIIRNARTAPVVSTWRALLPEIDDDR
jgi:hypothetical protein